MKIGNLRAGEPFLSLAPLAGYGDIAFRRLCREFGASLTVTEMISVKGLTYGNEKTESMLRIAPCEVPACVQLFGSDPEDFYKAIKLPALDKFDCIDINMGCPVPKVTKCGEGSALMKDPARAADIVRACVDAAGGRPVTVKHRLGQNAACITAPSFAARMEEAGAAAVTVHGRTVEQGYRGVADWQAIQEVVRAVRIPVIGNGDIGSRADALRATERFGVAGVAIGRGALGNPAVFAAHSELPLVDVILRHIDYALAYFPAAVAVRTLRKHLCRYLAGVPHTSKLRAEINAIADPEELKTAIGTLRQKGEQ